MTDLIDAIVERSGGGVLALSRAASPVLADRLSSVATLTTVPISGGLTVWDAAPPQAVCVVETPNHLGIAEPLPDSGTWTGVRRSTAIDPSDRLIDAIESDVPLAEVSRLLGRLESVKGISVYHRDLSARWFTVLASNPELLTISSSAVVPAVLGAAFPDIPGGVRIEVQGDASAADISRYAAAVEAARSADNA